MNDGTKKVNVGNVNNLRWREKGKEKRGPELSPRLHFNSACSAIASLRG